MSGRNFRYLEVNRRGKEKIVILSVLLISFLLTPFLNNFNIYNNLNEDNQKNEELPIEYFKTQDLVSDNTFNGIGAPWNVTHFANGTKTNLAVSFNNNSYDNSQYVELYGWMGYQLNSTITNLYDTRNWINGTFHCGPDDNYDSRDDNDSNYLTNWTFNTMDTGQTNYMSGNYFDDAYSGSDGADCLQLLIGDYNNYYYDVGDKCWWETIFEIDRGDVDQAWLSFAAFPKYSDLYNNHFVLQVIINNKTLWGNGLASMLEACGNSTDGQWYNPPPIYLDVNDDQLFPNGVKDMNITLEFKRVSGNTGSGYAEDYSVLIDNVSLIVKSKAKPSQLDLQLNNDNIIDNVNYGEGYCGMIGNWNGSVISSVEANFSSNLNWPLTFEEDGIWISYKIELDTNLSLYMNKSTPESYYTADPDLNYQGSAFIVSNNSNTNWTTYAHMEIPTGYEETNMTIEYPSDYNLTRLVFSQNPDSLSQTTIKQLGNKKIVNIPVSSITDNTNGFWKITAVSPNYCKDLEIYNNATGDWEPNNEFLSGEFINITGQVNNSQLISGYIQQTRARLQIRFPNGTIWAAKTQLKSVSDIGWVYFDPFMIPDNVPYYEAGEYEAIITWNNSYSSFDLNETGVIYKKFTVIHDSLLYPDQGIYFIENVIDDRIINIKVSFNDIVDDTAIDYALIYTDFTGSFETLDRISPGYYLYEFNASKATAGNNTVTIYANHSFYLNKVINITVDVIKETLLTVEYEDFTVPWNQNFTVRFNFTEKSPPFNGINATDDISIDWLGDYHLTQPIEGQYELKCNTSSYDSGTLQSFIISIDPYKYEAQSVLIRVQITELETSLKLLVNDIPTNYSDTILVELDETINITVQYRDNLTKNHLPGATVNLLGIDVLNEINDQYTLIMGAAVLDQGITALTIFAQLGNYTPQSINFFIEVVEKETNLQLLLNSEEKTLDPVYNLTIGEILNITIKYTEQSGAYIPNAVVQLIGEGILINLTKDDSLQQHSIELDTAILTIKVNLFSIVAKATNYEIQTKSPIITINRISTLINISSQINAEPGDDVTLEVILLDTYFGGTIKDVVVTYKWAYGQGELLDLNNTGTYEGFLEKVPEGTYTITINAFKSDNYDFITKEITLIVTRTETGPGPDLSWLVYVLIAAIIGLVGIFTLYQKTLKYPPTVRKSRKIRKKIRKGKKTKPVKDIASREDLIKDQIESNVETIQLEKKTENGLKEK